MIFRQIMCHGVALSLSLLLGLVAAQAQFTTVLDIPPDPNLGDNAFIGSDTQLNLGDGGAIGNFFTAGVSNGSSTNIEVNITGGTVGRLFHAHHSTVNISGGVIGGRFRAKEASIVNISGGEIGNEFIADNTVSVNTPANNIINFSGGAIGDSFKMFRTDLNMSGGRIGDNFEARAGTQVVLSGGTIGSSPLTAFNVKILGRDFRRNGLLIGRLKNTGDKLLIPYGNGVVYTGTFVDGTPFAFSVDENDRFGSKLALEVAELAPIGPPLITASTDEVPLGIREGQTLVVDAGSVVEDDFNAGRGSTVTIQSGGTVGRNLEAVDAVVNIHGGSVGNGFDAFLGTTVNMTGGSVGNNFLLGTNSTLNLSGGYVAAVFIRTANTVDVSGGTLGGSLVVSSSRSVKLTGGDFRLDGIPIAGLETIGNTLQPNIPAGTLFTGILTDGSRFAYSSVDGDSFAENSLTLEVAAVPNSPPVTITAPADPVPRTIPAGSTLLVNAGGVLPSDTFVGPGSIVTVESGATVGNNLEALGAEINIAVDTVGGDLDAFSGSSLNIAGGAFNNVLAAYSSIANIADGSFRGIFVTKSSTLNLSGGTVFTITVRQDSTLNMTGGRLELPKPSGGVFPGRIAVQQGGTMNLHGGSAGEFSSVNDGSTWNMFGGSLGKEFDALAGSIVNISGGEIGPSFTADAGSTVNITGGIFGENFRANGLVNISDGTFGSNFDVGGSGIFNFTGGVLRDLEAFSSRVVNMSNGTVNGFVMIFHSAEFNLSGGTVFGPVTSVGTQSTVNISGGLITGSFHNGGTLNLFGAEFLLNGVEISGLLPGQPLTILDRDVTLSGILSDGSPFNFNLNSTSIGGAAADLFRTTSTLTVTLAVPEPRAFALAALCGAILSLRRKLFS